MADMEVDMVADLEVDMVADMEVDKVADMMVDKVANMEVDMMADHQQGGYHHQRGSRLHHKAFLRPTFFKPKLLSENLDHKEKKKGVKSLFNKFAQVHWSVVHTSV